VEGWTDPDSEASFDHADAGVAMPADMHQCVGPMLNLSINALSIRIIWHLRWT